MRPVGILVVLVLVVLQTVRLSVGAPIDTTIETTTGPITTTNELTPPSFTCPPNTCDDANCYLDKGISACGLCICSDPICMLVSCGPDEQCVPNEYNPSGYTCVSTSEITTESPTCLPIACDGPNCYVDNGPSGCPEICICESTPASFTCPPIECEGPNCYLDKGIRACGECICSDPICMRVTCGPDEQCVPNEYNSYDYTCVSTTTSEITTESPTCPPIACDDPNCYVDNGPSGCPEICICESTPASFTCPPIECDGPNCYLDKGLSYCGECICNDPICMRVTCGPDEQCVPNEYNSYDYTCVSTTASVADP